jgi:hypothetical protein
MKTRINDACIYFFMEPNIVFVYQMVTRNYLTLADFPNNIQLDTYEMNEGESFEQFYHKDHQELEGRGYFINQEDLMQMVEEINKQIQKYRKLVEQSASPVHIVTPEYSAGTLRVGLERPKLVIGFPDFFSIGPLWKLDEISGQALRAEWLYDNINFLEEWHAYQNKYTNTLREIEDIPEVAPIYIWYADNADEQTGLRFLLHLVKDKANDVYLMNTTELYKEFASAEDLSGYTGQLEPEILQALFEKSKTNPPLTNAERVAYEREWQTLAQLKDTLRIWKNGEIVPVSEDYYDAHIINMIKKLHQKREVIDFIKTSEVIEELMAEQFVEAGWFYLEYRIRFLIYNGVLEVKGIPKSVGHYRVRIREGNGSA